MGMSAVRRLGSVLGYGLFVAVVLAAMLRLLFPGEAVRHSFEAMLGRVWPELHWQVGGVALELPAHLTFRPIEGYANREDRTPLIRFERLSIQPHLLDSLRSWSGQVGFRLVAGKGSVAGTAQWQGGSEGGRIEGAIQDVSLTEFPWLSRQLGRSVQGTVAGTFTAEVRPTPPAVAALEARISVANGQLGLQRPILGHREIPFARASVVVHGQGETLTLEQGLLASNLLDSRFAGTVILGRDPVLWQIDVHGVAEPKEGFFKGLDNTVNLQAFRLQLKDHALPFSITGGLVNPGIHYGEYAMLVQTLEQELR